MKRPAQRDTNPFANSDTNKRYYTFDYYTRHRFGEKCAKISLDAGFTCPNIDGTVGSGGCIYCLGGSSGAACEGTLAEQYARGVDIMRRKWDCRAFIPYLQAHTNTYADTDTLRRIYGEAAKFDGAVMLAVATRPDCLPDSVCRLLSEISREIPVLVELGLQSTNDRTAEIINRGHSFAQFIEGYERLRSLPGDISVCIHLINGLPGEDRETMIKSAIDTAALHPHMVKLHLLHVLRATKLCEMYERGEYAPMNKDEYVDTVVRQIELMPPDTVIARVTGDGTADSLAAPEWSKRKTAVSNDIDKELFRRNTFQGKLYKMNTLY